MNEGQLLITKELTLAAVEKLPINALSSKHSPEEVAEVIGMVYQTIAKKVKESAAL